MQATILDSKWWTPPMPGLSVLQQAVLYEPPLYIGAIAIESFAPEGLWKVYIGFARTGDDTDTNCQNIARHGMPIGSREAACGLFPQLDPEKFVY